MKLWIDTATKHLCILLEENGTIIDKLIQEGHNDHSETLMYEIESMFERHQISVKDLSGVVVGEGPGSYTGVRIAVTVAKMFTTFMKLPLYKMSTFALIASSTNETSIVEIDARRNHIFTAVVSNQGEIIEQPKFCHTDERFTGHPVITELQSSVNLNKVPIIEVEDIHPFTPNYLREWGE